MQGNRSVEWAVLAASAAVLVFAAACAADVVADPEAGAETYNAVCKGCHGVSIAPTLRGVVGRPIASVASFAGYSDALKAKGSMSWTEANLDAFLTAPATFAPGTLMTQTIADAQQRADLIAYLAMLPPPR
jgi:cytochrome c